MNSITLSSLLLLLDHMPGSYATSSACEKTPWVAGRLPADASEVPDRPSMSAVRASRHPFARLPLHALRPGPRHKRHEEPLQATHGDLALERDLIAALQAQRLTRLVGRGDFEPEPFDDLPRQAHLLGIGL